MFTIHPERWHREETAKPERRNGRKMDDGILE